MKSLGIDIGTSSIKVVEIQTSSKGYQITQYFEHKMGLNQAHDPELEIIDYLRSLLEKYDADSTHINVAVRQERVVARFKEFPFSDRTKIAKSLPFELEEELPFSSDNAIFDGRVIRNVGAGAEVLACATPSTQVEKVLKLCTDAGFEPHVLSAEGLAYANIFEKWQDAPESLPAAPPALDESFKPEKMVKLLLHIGHTQSILMAFEDHHLIACRSIMWGGRNLADAIAKKYNLPYAEARKEMELKAFILTTQQANNQNYDIKIFSDTIAKSVRELVRDVQLSMLELKAEFNAQFLSLEMTGGLAAVQGLGPFLTQNLELPCNRLLVLDLFPNVMIEKTDQTHSTLGVAIGLAIEGLRKPRNPAITFMRGEFQKQNHFLRNTWERWGHTITIAGALVVVLFIYSNLRESISIQLEERARSAMKTTAKTVAGMSNKQATESNINKYIRENRKKASDLKNLASLAGMNSAGEILNKVSSAVPTKSAISLDLQRFNLQDQTLKLEGFVANPREAGQLQKSLSSIAIDGRVQSQSSNLVAKPGQYAFAFELKVDRAVKGVSK